MVADVCVECRYECNREYVNSQQHADWPAAAAQALPPPLAVAVVVVVTRAGTLGLIIGGD